MALLFLILKILLWIVVGLLGLLLLLVLIVLLVPITYSAKGSKYETTAISAKVGWLFGLIRFQVEIVNKRTVFVVKLLWKELFSSEETEEEEEKEPEKMKSETISEPKPAPKQTESKPESKPEPKFEPKPKSELKKSKSRRVDKQEPLEKPEEAKEEPKEKTLDKVKDTIRFIRSPEQAGVFKHILYRVKKVLKSILPRKFKGNLRFGLENPFVTGIIAGGASIFYPKYNKHLKLIAEFNEPVMEGDVAFSGRIIIGVIGYHGARLILDRRIRRMIKKFKP